MRYFYLQGAVLGDSKIQGYGCQATTENWRIRISSCNNSLEFMLQNSHVIKAHNRLKLFDPWIIREYALSRMLKSSTRLYLVPLH